MTKRRTTTTTKTKTRAGGVKFYVPPFAKSAKDGAPDRLWLVEENRQKQKQVQRQMRGPFAPLRMTAKDKGDGNCNVITADAMISTAG
jgi:hypothetical protein